MAELVDLDELVRLLRRSDGAKGLADFEQAAADLDAYLNTDRLWGIVAELRAGRTLADDLRQYESHGLIALDAALDAYRKALRGAAP